MKWFKKPEPEFEIVTNDVPLSTVYRWYLYDTDLDENVNELAETIGLTPISEEGDAKEREDSDARLINLSPLFPFIENMADLSSSVMSSIHVKALINSEAEMDESEVEEVVASMFSVYKAIALSTLIGTMSAALELGIIHSNTLSSDTYFMDGDDDNE